MSNDGGATGARGRLVGGRYRLIERIGSGGTGTVWRALDELVQCEVAVKQLRLPGHPGDERHRRAAHRLHHEARAAARVDHPAAVVLHDVVMEDDGVKEPEGRDGTNGLPWIVTELVRGESLHELLDRGPLPPAEAARIGLAVLGALRAAHAVGIVHRDVKPANILLGPHRRVVLTDFGIAHVQGEESHTGSGEFVGSPEFTAPERTSGSIAGPASDLWSLGVLLYAAVEGRSPFRRTTPESTLAAITAEDTPEPKQAGALGPLIVRLLAKDPEERPDAEEVAGVLEAATKGRPAPEPAAPADRSQDTSQDTSGTPEPTAAAGTVRPGRSVPAATPVPVRDDRPRAPRPEPGPRPAPEPGSEPIHEPEPEPVPESEREAVLERGPEAESFTRHLFRPAPVVALGALLAGGVWAATTLASDTGSAAEHTGRVTASTTATTSASAPAPAGPALAPWTAHRETALAAVLHLPRGYRELAGETGAGDRPGTVLYASDDDGSRGLARVRLTRWDRAPRSPMAQAQHEHVDWGTYDREVRTRYTRTSFQGHEAVLAETTGGMEEPPSRLVRLLIRTDDGPLYELSVHMPEGGVGEKYGTAVFEGARDRLEIGTVRSTTP
ncbi:serine/threonine protein kinase [Streptomyces sp. NBC_01635]|uniref:serine/threonine-protein kinase n=1 Tax=Streptomyces sp. NBC_01635 TaxID=2975904 RepID=UPI00386DB8E5|nr:serine/threonine protein kinase [Streptomyces sp. NBC_01635]